MILGQTKVRKGEVEVCIGKVFWACARLQQREWARGVGCCSPGRCIKREVCSLLEFILHLECSIKPKVAQTVREY